MPSGSFIGESQAIPVGALLITGLSLPPKKAALILATTKCKSPRRIADHLDRPAFPIRLRQNARVD